MSSRHGRNRAKKTQVPTQVPTQWSEWQWDNGKGCWARYRLDAYGAYEFDHHYGDSNNSNEVAQTSTSYEAPHIPLEDSNLEQYEGSDVRTGRERSQKKSPDKFSSEGYGPEPLREPSVSPSRPVSPGPPPPPFPTTEDSSSSYPSTAGYAVGYYGVSSASPTVPTSSAYLAAPTEQYGFAGDSEYNERSYESSNMLDNSQEDILVTIKKRDFKATLSPSKESFISADTVESLRLKKESIKSWRYTNPESRKEYEIRERVRTDIEMTGRGKLRDVKLYVTPRKYSAKNPVILGTDIIGTPTPHPAASDYLSSRSSDSGYGTANSRRPSFNLPLRPVDSAFTTAAAPATYADSQQNYSSGSQAYHQSIYAQNLPSVPEAPGSSHSTSSYPKKRGKTIPGPPDSATSHSSYHDAYYASSHDRNQESGFSNYDSGGHPGMTGASWLGEGGMEYNLPRDDDRYTLRSDSHARPYTTPRTPPPSDESQNVYSSASDDTGYADCVAHQ